MAVLLSFPDDEVKARRRCLARARADAVRAVRIAAAAVEVLSHLIARRPDGTGDSSAADLAGWINDANWLLQRIKEEPARIRAEVHVAELCLKLKGLVDEAEHARFLLVERALDSGAPGASRLSPGQAATGARRAPGAPVAALTANLVSDPLAGAVSSAGSSVAGPGPSPDTGAGPALAADGGLVGGLVSDNLRIPAVPPSSSAAGCVKRPGGAGYPSGRFTARGGCEEDRETGEGCFEAQLPARFGGWPVSFFLTGFWGVFHALTMRLFRRAVSEKGNCGFSGGEGRS